jgi:hypothetical protein
MLVWAEPFDQYGGSLTLLSQAGYTVSSNEAVNAPGRTGPYALAFLGAGRQLRRTLDVAATTIGSGVGWYQIDPGPASSNNNAGITFLSAGGVVEFRVWVDSDLSLVIYDRNSIFKGRTAPNSIIRNSWTWIECRAIKNSAGASTGIGEIRINGISKLIVNNMDLPNSFTAVGLESYGGGYSGTVYFDDWIIWDNTGADNNTFMSDRRLFYSAPSANGATQNFIASAGSAFNCVNVIPPVDTTYIEGQNPGDISDFQKAAIGINSTNIAAVVIWGRMFKTDAGVASGRLGINSVGNISNSAEIFPGTSGACYQFVIERNPNGNIIWTKAAADAAFVRATRVQ